MFDHFWQTAEFTSNHSPACGCLVEGVGCKRPRPDWLAAETGVNHYVYIYIYMYIYTYVHKYIYESVQPGRDRTGGHTAPDN